MPEQPKESCDGCFFFDKENSECHRYPPEEHGNFPFVEPEDWCGEFKNKGGDA